MAQFGERLPRLLGAAAESATGMKTSTWLPLAICLASANDPAECVGATGIPEASVNPLRKRLDLRGVRVGIEGYQRSYWSGARDTGRRSRPHNRAQRGICNKYDYGGDHCGPRIMRETPACRSHTVMHVLA